MITLYTHVMMVTKLLESIRLLVTQMVNGMGCSLLVSKQLMVHDRDITVASPQLFQMLNIMEQKSKYVLLRYSKVVINLTQMKSLCSHL